MMGDTERKRRRPAVSCVLCRRRKIRCNRQTPCSNCVRSKNSSCIYGNDLADTPRRNLAPALKAQQPNHSAPAIECSGFGSGSMSPGRPVPSIVNSSTTPSTTPSRLSQEVDYLKNRVRQLEERLSQVTEKAARSPGSTSTSTINIETTSSSLAGTFSVHNESRPSGETPAINRGVLHKTRLFGQSHWGNGAVQILRELFEIIEPHIQNGSKLTSGMQKCKLLARVIKSQWTPPWPAPPKLDLPQKDVADKLVDCYLRTTETVYRILHIPTFKRDYEEVWLNVAPQDTAFLVQLKLVLAIGATTYDEKFSMRASAVRWIYEAQAWLAEPEFKARLNTQVLQTNILLLIARQTASLGGSLVWISAGSLIRSAMLLGLHRDPTFLPESTVFAIEMHRRLWNTVLEIALQSSIDSGAPPLISLGSFDAEPPRNLNDDQLMFGDPLPASDDTFTQMSVAIALRKTFPIRLAVAEFLNNLQSRSTYEETLQLDAELRISHKELCRALHGLKSATGSSPSRFQVQVVDFIMHRHFSALHTPFFVPALRETTYAFSRKVFVDVSLKIWRLVQLTPTYGDAASPTGEDDVVRLAICGSQFFRGSALQASLTAAAELMFQLHEETGLSPAPVRPDLLAIVNDAITWSFRCIEAGETNIKGYLFTCLVAARVDGLMKGTEKGEFPESLIRAAEAAQEKCLRVLEEKAAEGRTGTTVDAPNHMGLDIPEGTEDWDIIMPNCQFNLEDPMNWLFDDEATQFSP
ncbi:hypothetical protein EMPG_12485 [Blastomyces silverae]|uniref:Zn(2)-C6 fungal-type domain-containing protein n=1 Tax=Blastomyces silverae TaxID=2060906 RepID=A0A0H1BNA0_9EURO|nr:hypothetical protein EMPG_12485 [Blastomyces silverae]